MDELTVVQKLTKSLDLRLPILQKWDAYYNGEQPLAYLPAELLAEMDGRIKQVVINWPQLVIDSLEERLDVEGFRFGETSADGLWDIWQANNLDEESQQTILDALTMMRGYTIVGAGDSPDDPPVITVESPEQVLTSWHPRTREVTAAIKRWKEDDLTWVTLYYPGGRVTMREDSYTHTGWREDQRDSHDLDVIPVTPIVNRPRTKRPDGRSELAIVAPLADAACKIATDMMVAAEFHAMPRRWIVGMTEDDMVDDQGRKKSRWSQIAGRIWTTAARPDEVKLGEFQQANLTNFHDTINSLARLVASLAGLPPHFLGYADQNPASADAIRSAETRLVKRAERKQRTLGAGIEETMRKAILWQRGELPANAHRLETVWRDPSTPTVAQKADAAVKLHQAGIVPLRQTRLDLGYTQPQITEMEADDERAVGRILAGDFASLVGPKPLEVTSGDAGAAQAG